MKLTKYSVITVSLIVVGWITARLISNTSLYPFNDHYSYQFTNGMQFSTTLDQQGFTWPLVTTDWDTAFLKIHVKSSWLGYLFEPYIAYTVNGETYRQYFERGVNGERYLNISSLNNAKPQTPESIALTSRYLSWPKQTTTITTFNNPDPADATILVISPHPDDAEIAAFGFYNSYSNNTYVITITAGDGYPGYHHFINLYSDLAQHYEIKGKLRAVDSVSVPLLANIPSSRTGNLGYFDSKTREMYENPDEIISAPFANINSTGIYRQFNHSNIVPNADVPATWHNLVTDLTHIIEHIKPDIIVTPHPLVDYHNDHRYATVAVLEALQQSNVQTGYLFLYAVHHVNTGPDVYPFGPQNTLFSLSPWNNKQSEFYSVYSHPQNWEQQKWKFFALDAQRDLRPAPYGYALKHAWPIYLKNYIQGLDTHPYYSYYRRAIRQNELFYVLPFEHGDTLLQAM